MILNAASKEDFRSKTLRDRANVHAADQDVVLLRAHVAGEECGLVVMDLNSGDDDEAILVEIFVTPDRRSSGLGSQLLICAEAYARDAGRLRISLDAEPLDSELDDDSAKEKLISWYKRRGYVEIGGRCDELEKTLDGAADCPPVS